MLTCFRCLSVSQLFGMAPALSSVTQRGCGFSKALSQAQLRRLPRAQKTSGGGGQGT